MSKASTSTWQKSERPPLWLTARGSPPPPLRRGGKSCRRGPVYLSATSRPASAVSWYRCGRERRRAPTQNHLQVGFARQKTRKAPNAENFHEKSRPYWQPPPKKEAV